MELGANLGQRMKSEGLTRIIEKQLFREPSLNSLLRLTKAAISSPSPVCRNARKREAPKPRVEDSGIKKTGRQSLVAT